VFLDAVPAATIPKIYHTRKATPKKRMAKELKVILRGARAGYEYAIE